MTWKRLAVAIAAGLVLAAIPFARYAHFGARGEAHVDHEPRHGGQLGMVGDYHIELVRRRGRAEVFVSDAWRQPVQPEQAWIAFDGGEPTTLAWQDRRLLANDNETGQVAEVIVVLADDTRLVIEFEK